MKRTRRNHGATFQAQVALAVVKGDKMLAELTEQFSVHTTQITEWKQQRRHVTTLMRRMGITAIYRIPRTSHEGVGLTV